MFLIILFLCEYIIYASSDCVTPPMECPNENITFWLYTRANQDNPHELLVTNSKSLESAPWVKDAPIKILIHGYTGHKNFSPNTEIRPAYMECCDYNIISIDYNPIAREPCYLQAAHNVELVGKCTAQLVDELVTNYHFKLPMFHVIGFSLGGQTAGFIANYLRSGVLDRISALDPALPLFVTNDDKRKVDVGDAKFVDCLHTNALEKGKLEASGHVDFYANGGITQPGCVATAEHTRILWIVCIVISNPTKIQPEYYHYEVMIMTSLAKISAKSGCDHARAPEYYAESIITNVGFYATNCFSWITCMIGWCDLFSSDQDILFGEYVPLNASGMYFFQTNSKSPFAQGSNARKSRSIEKLEEHFSNFSNKI